MRIMYRDITTLLYKARVKVVRKLFDVVYTKDISPEEYHSLIVEDLKQGYPAFDYSDFYDFAANREDLSTYVEVGSWKGFSTVYLAKRLQEKKEGILYAVDLWTVTPEMLFRWHPACSKKLRDRNRTLLARFGTNIDKDKLIYDIYCENIAGNGVRDVVRDIRKDSTEAAYLFEDNQVDFVFIDADHSYEKVKADILAWRSKVKNGGIIAGHDFNKDGVRRAVVETLDNPVQFGKQVWYVNL